MGLETDAMNLLAIKDALIAAKSSIITGLCVAALCLPLGYCQGLSAGKAKAKAAVAVATVEVMRVDGDAKEVAAIERRNDDAAIVAQKEELTDAVADLPDEMPSTRRVALACARLRAQGTATGNLSACR